MKLLHNVTLEVFSKTEDSLDSACLALDALAPISVKEVLKSQWRWHKDKKHTKVYDLPKKGVSLYESETPGSRGRIVVLSYRFTKERDTNDFVKKLQRTPLEQRTAILTRFESASPESVGAGLKLVLRFDMSALADDKLFFGGDRQVIARLNLAAYPKRFENCVETARKVLGVIL